ncbi:MAG TPA: hypothetical protein VEM40_12840 [Nitrospirota bacterium]|nr:hypothetical protein [Nitrospirota bacterium]
MERITKLSDAIRKLMEVEFSGYIKINFSQGSIGRVEKSEEFEDTAILITGRDNGKKSGLGGQVNHETLKAVPIMLLLSIALAGCAASAKVRPPQPAGESGNVRVVRSGDVADIRYLCRLKSGEVAAATDPVAESQPKSNIYEKREETGPLSVQAIGADEADLTAGSPFTQPSFEEEIQYYLGRTIIGMKQGDKLTAELKAKDSQSRVHEEYILRLNRVRTHPKLMVMQKHTYEYATKQSPEIGQAYTYDPDFPGKVESISDEGVTIRIMVTPGAVKETPFGSGRYSEDGDNYKMEIDARKGALIRMAGLVGRIVYVDDKAFHIDFGNPFGGETLICDVTVEKIAEEKTAKSGK